MIRGRGTAGAVRITAYGFFGMGNLGNDASLRAFLECVRAEDPSAEVRCLASHPVQVEQQYGIPARSMMARAPEPLSGSMLAKVLARALDVPRTWRLLSSVDVVVVPGMGVLESSLGANPLGLPYWMFLVALFCRLRGRRMILLSVGADRASNPLTRWFFRRVVGLAAYCSFRDAASLRALRAPGVSGPDHPVPDLAFGLPVPHTAGAVVPGRVVIGVMRFPDHGDANATDRYQDGHVRVMTRLVEQGRSVRVVIGDLADFPLAETLVARVRQDVTASPDAIGVARCVTQEEIMAEMSRAEVVVASRFHNVLGALRLGVPAVSLGYAEKNAALLDEFGLCGYDQPIADFDSDLVMRQIAAAPGTGGGVEGRLKVVRSYQAALEKQYQQIRPLLRP